MRVLAIRYLAACLVGALLLASPGQAQTLTNAAVSAGGSVAAPPPMRWAHRSDGRDWTRAALLALNAHASVLAQIVPRDVSQWCRGYAEQTAQARQHFWVGFLSALAKHESTWRQAAVGGGGRWFGLTQIQPSTARFHGCQARSGEALKQGELNLACALRIMARTVPRDGVIAGKAGRWQGVSADWGPLRDPGKRAEMAAWLQAQPYCQVPPPKRSLRPATRGGATR